MTYKIIEKPDMQVSERLAYLPSIYVTAYPRSGNTWLNRLLSDLLSSPMQTEPGQPVEWFGEKQEWNYVIRKRHLQGHDFLNPDGPVIFIHRDPRDIAVSAMFYRSLDPTDESLMSVIQQMISGKVRRKLDVPGVYETWIRSWLTRDDAIKTRYNLLFVRPVKELIHIVKRATGLTLKDDWVTDCVARQGFKNWKGRYPHSMRRGVVGDWRNYFKLEHGKFMATHLNDLMMEQGYILQRTWWRELPE